MNKKILSVLLILTLMLSAISVFAAPTYAAGTKITPYQKPGGMTMYTGDVNKSFSMMGIDFIDGFTVDTNGTTLKEILYSLDKNYQLITMDIGHLDNASGTDVAMKIYFEGTYIETVDLTRNMATKHYSLNVSGVDQLKIELVENSDAYPWYSYGFANVIAYTNADLVGAGITTIPDVSSSEDYMKTNLESDNSVHPYQSDSTTIYNGDINKSFEMMGIKYHDGFVVGTNGGTSHTVLYNLGKEFQMLTMDIGHLDNADGTTAMMQIYFDGEYIESVDLTHGMATTNYTLNVAGVNQLKILIVENSTNYPRFSYGFANVTVYTVADLADKGITTVPEVSEKTSVKNTNLIVGECPFPYSYNDCIHLYKGDINSSFTMMGEKYINGVIVKSSGYDTRSFIYNLGGIFDTFSFKAGHIDGMNTTSAKLDFYCDGEFAYSIGLTKGMNVSEHTIDVKNVNQLVIKFVNNGAGYPEFGYGTADMAVTHTHTTVKDAAVPATCTANGKTEGSHCATCKQVLVAQKTTIALGHAFGGYTYDNNATCTKDGTETSACSRCSAKNTRTKAGTAKGHKFGSYTNNNNATCTTNATQSATCTNGCGTTDTKVIAGTKKGHSFTKYVYNNNATTQKDGTETAKCDRGCGAIDTRVKSGTKITVVIKDTSKVFNDVKAKKWYTNAIDYAYSYGFVSGITSNEFGLNTNITRGMFVTILARIAGVNTSSAANKAAATKFTDVAKGKYYSAAVKWGYDNNVVSGMSATTFEPNTPITRQQLCVMIVNFAKQQKVSIAVKETKANFTDNSSIAKWAKSAVTVCQQADIVNGYSEGAGTFFKPKGNATRAEAAQILYKFHKDFMK